MNKQTTLGYFTKATLAACLMLASTHTLMAQETQKQEIHISVVGDDGKVVTIDTTVDGNVDVQELLRQRGIKVPDRPAMRMEVRDEVIIDRNGEPMEREGIIEERDIKVIRVVKDDKMMHPDSIAALREKLGSIPNEADIRELLKSEGISIEDADTVIFRSTIDTITTDELLEGSKMIVSKNVLILRHVQLSDVEKADLKLLRDNKVKVNSGTGNTLQVQNLNFAPNPNNGRFRLNFNLPAEGQATVRIMDMQGKTIFEDKPASTGGGYSRDIDISGQGPGMYFLQIQQGQKSLYKKVVIQ